MATYNLFVTQISRVLEQIQLFYSPFTLQALKTGMVCRQSYEATYAYYIIILKRTSKYTSTVTLLTGTKRRTEDTIISQIFRQ